ncbi:hypothetical protein L7F22_043839 [Adiantum nelumboides]|nr:hypothetical protein [Adiantum nelumboides]
MSRSIQTPPEEIEDPFENLESQKSRAEDERKLNKLDFAEAGNEIGSTIDGEQSEGQDQDAMKNKVKEGALIGHEAILADIERSMNKFIEEIRTSLQNSKQEEPEQAIKNYNKILHDHLEPQQPAFHGTHPGLAGHRAIPSAIGHSSRAGGPTAPQNIRQATKDLRPKRPSYAQQGSLIFSRQDGSDLAQIPLAERSSGLPSFQSPSRFPGGDVISTQGSLHHSTSNVAEDKSLDSVKEDLLLNTRWRMKKFVAEFICTMFLLLIGTSVQCQVRLSQSSAGFYQSINWAWGFAVLCTIHLAGGISGAHANPGITVALTLLRAAIAYGIYLPAINIYQGKDVRTITGNHETGSLFVTVPDSMATPLTAFFNEFVASAVLGLVVFAVGDDSNSPPGDGMSGLIIGISVTMIVTNQKFGHIIRIGGYTVQSLEQLQPSSVRDRAAALCGMERAGTNGDSIDSAQQYTSADGRPFPSLTTSLKIGAHPVQSDTLLLEKQQAFDRMKIQERIVHPAGSSAFGKFTVTHDVSKLTKAKLFQPGTVTPCYTRFSTVTLGREYPDSARNPRGFATKFYTPDGNYDMVGLNWPIFFVRDPWLGPDNIRSQQRNPANFLLDFQAWFDFLANVPESMHAGTMLLSDHGTPKGWRFMNGFGCHTFSWVNEEGKRTFIKYHWLSQQGTKNLTMEEATTMCGQDPDYAKRDLWQHIEKGGKCEWQLNVQTMTEDEANSTDFDPFDVTKIWPRGKFPMQPVGTLTLDKNPENYFRDVEQAAFSPGSLVPGIEASPDSLLLWRMFFYRDAQYHRLGVNLHQIRSIAHSWQTV